MKIATLKGLVVVNLLVLAGSPVAEAKVFDRVSEATKTLAVAEYTVRYCPSLVVDPDVETDWLNFSGHPGGPHYQSEREIREVAVLLDAYRQDSTMDCAAIFLSYGPMGTVVNGMVDIKSIFHGIFDLF